MAYPENTYTGNGSTTNYSLTFEYLEETDIKVSLDGVTTTAYSLANATTVSFTAAPANGVAIRIYRETDVSSAQATFFAGSAIRAQDLNNNNLQTLYAVQEATNNAALAPTAITTANTAKTMQTLLLFLGHRLTGITLKFLMRLALSPLLLLQVYLQVLSVTLVLLYVLSTRLVEQLGTGLTTLLTMQKAGILKIKQTQ
jgi:hypothetical protein